MPETAAGGPAEPMQTRQVLLCGGPMDGQWIALPTWEYEVRAVRPARSRDARDWYRGGLDGVADSTDVNVVVYVVEALPLAFPGIRGSLWIGVPTVLVGSERSQTIMRAVLQRDVAQHLLDQR